MRSFLLALAVLATSPLSAAQPARQATPAAPRAAPLVVTYYFLPG